MVNIPKSDLGFDPTHGRNPIHQYIKGMTGQVKGVATSRPFFAFLAITTAVFGIYYGLIAAPIYVSQSTFSIRGREQQLVDTSFLAGLTGSSGAGVETSEIEQYIESGEMLSLLDQRFHLRQLYSAPRLDLLHWMSRDASREGFLAFYRKMVSVDVDRTTNIVTVQVKSFDAKSAQEVADAILDSTSGYLDSLSATVRKDTLKASEQELVQAEKAVRESRLAMSKYRTQSGVLDPVAAATAASTAQAQLAGLLTYNTETSPQVVQLRAMLKTLEGHSANPDRRLPRNASTAARMAQRINEYEGLMVTNEYAERQLVAALGSYDTARSLAGQRERFLVRIVRPNLPDTPTLPHRMVSFLEAMLVSIAAYGIIALAIAGVRDHQGI